MTEQGLPDAPINLGIACALGPGVPPDLIEANQWQRTDSFATEEQRGWAVRTRDLIALRMVPDQIARARRLARDRIGLAGTVAEHAKPHFMAQTAVIPSGHAVSQRIYSIAMQRR